MTEKTIVEEEKKRCACCHKEIDVKKVTNEDGTFYYVGNYLGDKLNNFFCSSDCLRYFNRLKISDLIKILERAEREHGDIYVVVQYRDYDEEFDEIDYWIENYCDKEKNVWVL